MELYFTQELNKWGKLYGEKIILEHPLNHPQRMVQFSSVAQSCLTLCNPMNYSMPGFPVHHVGDAIQPSHPLSSPSPPAPNPSQH